MREINSIIIHCSDSDYGNRDTIDSWHRNRGWDEIGYHYVVMNAYPHYYNLKDNRPDPGKDGEVALGRDIEKIGAHVKGHNDHSIGICLIGRQTFTARQIRVLVKLVQHLMSKFKVRIGQVRGHYELNPLKTCPNIDMDWLRKLINESD